jgi:hypothetical protein
MVGKMEMDGNLLPISLIAAISSMLSDPIVARIRRGKGTFDLAWVLGLD